MLPSSILLHFDTDSDLSGLDTVVARYAARHTLVAVTMPCLELVVDRPPVHARYTPDEEARTVFVEVWTGRKQKAVDITGELIDD